MKTTWIDVHKVLLEDTNTHAQAYAKDIRNGVEISATLNHVPHTPTKVYIPLPTTKVHTVRFAYKYLRHPTDDRSKITKVQILKMSAPGQTGTILYEESLQLNSETHTFHTITCPPLFSQEGFFLAIEVTIVDLRDKYVIGPIGIEDHSVAITEVNPLDFGAVGDGVTDDYTALNEAILYALANDIPLNLANRAYSFSKTLHIKPEPGNEAGITIRNGELHFTSTTGSAVLIDKETTNFTPIHLENLAILGASCTGLNLGKVIASNLTNVAISGFHIGLLMRGCYGNQSFNCAMTDNGINVQIEPYDQGDGLVRSNDNKFWGCIFVRPTGFAAVYFPPGDELAGSNNTFNGCWFEGGPQYHVVNSSAHGTSFIDCRFENAFENPPDPSTPRTMILLEGGAQARILNCWFPGMGTPNPDDCLIRVGEPHRGARITNCVFSSTHRVLIDEGGEVEAYGNWVLPNKFTIPSHTH